MKVNLNKQFKDFKGEELKGESIAYSVAEALFFYGKDKPVSNDDKFKAYCISQKIIKSNGDIEITAEEACLIKRSMWRSSNRRRLWTSLRHYREQQIAYKNDRPGKKTNRSGSLDAN